MDLFEECIARLDTSLFDAIRSQSSVGDKRSWLALQAATRSAKGSYTYLEVGSYLGGSIQPHLLDPRCRRIFSIDKRPLEQPDDRGRVFGYPDSTTARMLNNLRQLAPDQVQKVICFDSDAKNVVLPNPAERPDLCLIDGEHTRSAVLDDFEACVRLCAPDAVIYFHDVHVIHPAIAEIVENLHGAHERFTAWKLDGLTYVIAMGKGEVVRNAIVQGMAHDGEAYLRAMRARDRRDRIVQHLPAFIKPALRSVRAAFTRP